MDLQILEHALFVMEEEVIHALSATDQEINKKTIFFGLIFVFSSLLMYFFLRNTDDVTMFKLLRINYGIIIETNNSFLKFNIIDLFFYLGVMKITEGIYHSSKNL